MHEKNPLHKIRVNQTTGGLNKNVLNLLFYYKYKCLLDTF